MPNLSDLALLHLRYLACRTQARQGLLETAVNALFIRGVGCVTGEAGSYTEYPLLLGTAQRARVETCRGYGGWNTEKRNPGIGR